MMKKKLFVAAICVMSAFSCKKDNQPNPVQDLFVGANFQGINWLAQPTARIENGDSLRVMGFHSQGNEYLVFKIRFTGIGTDTLKKANQASYYTTDGSGATTSNYKLDVTKTNTVTITSFAPTIAIAEGDFQLNFVKTSGGSGFNNTATFANGKLWVQVR
jgi:hypothetical protein